MIKITHIITDLSPGGAETMLYRLLGRMDTTLFKNEVISLTNLGSLAEKIQMAGIPVRALRMKKRTPDPFAFGRLLHWIRDSKPQIVQTWMYHANLIGGLAAHLAGDIPIVWGIHQATLDPQLNKRLTIWIAKACARMSGWLPKHVVFVSQAALGVHAGLGYAAKGMEVIPNGFDVDEFKPDSTARLSLRRELGIAEETVLVGMAAHFRPEKDHHNFIKAAARLHGLIPEIHFVLCGLGVTRNNQQLVRWMTEAGLSGCCHLIGERRDTPRFFSAVDIVTSSAATEAFPLSVGEAMACGTPCVVTNVGDSALIVGEAGRVVPSRNSEALAKAWLELVKAGPGIRRHLGMMARRRIQEHFELAATVNRYQSTYTKLITAKSSDTRLPAAARLEPCNKPLDVSGVAVPTENSVSL